MSSKYFLKGSYPSSSQRTRRAAYRSNLALRRYRQMQTRRLAASKNTGSALAMVNKRTGGYEDMENKFVDYEVSDKTISTTWAGSEIDPTTPSSISTAAQGDGENQRDGRVYYINSVHVNGVVEAPAQEDINGAYSDTEVRILLVWDTQTNAAQAQGEEVMSEASTADSYNSFRNLQNSKRFVVLKDKRLKLILSRAENSTDSGSLNVNGVTSKFSMNKKFKKPIKVRCTGTTATVASISDNSLHLYCVSTPSGLATAPVISYISRCRFSG